MELSTRQVNHRCCSVCHSRLVPNSWLMPSVTFRKHSKVCLIDLLLQNEHQWVFTQVDRWLPHKQMLLHWSWSRYFPVPTSPLRFPSRLYARSPTVHTLHWWSYECSVQHSMSQYADELLFYTTIQSTTSRNWCTIPFDFSPVHKLQLNCDKCNNLIPASTLSFSHLL